MRKRKTNSKIVSLILLLLGIGVGYALLSQDLTISGISKVRGNTWDIHFDNVVVNPNSVTLSTGDSAAAIDTNDDTLVEYTVTLNLPGDFYEFTVDAVNDGTVDGMIGTLTSKLNGVVIDSEHPLPVYLDYTISYSDGTPIANNHLLEAGDTETYKIRLEFKRDIENSELPSTLQTNTLSFEVDYLQKTNAAIEVPHPITGTRYMYNFEDVNTYFGQSLPSEVTPYKTVSEVQSAIRSRFGYDIPFYFRIVLNEDILTEAYIEFTITAAEASANSGMTAGTYALKGIDSNVDYESLDENYTYNKGILETAFGSSNCTENNNSTNYTCSVGDWQGFASKSGRSWNTISFENNICLLYNEGKVKCTTIS